MGKFFSNFKKKGGFSGLGKKLGEVGGKFAKAGGMITKVGGFFDPRIAEVGDAIKVAGEVSQGIGKATITGSKIGTAIRDKQYNKIGALGKELGDEGKSIAQGIKQGSQLKFMG